MKNLLAFLMCSSGALFGLNRLDLNQSDFIVEEKQIVISGFPDAFNPSLTRWNDEIVMSFRFRDPLTGSTNPIGLIFLDEKMNPKGKPQILDVSSNHSLLVSKAQDPRLIVLNGQLLMVYNNEVDLGGFLVRRMFFAPLFYEQNQFRIGHSLPLTDFQGEKPLRNEKNWVPFNYLDELHLAYSLNPHHIFSFESQSQKCLTCSSTSGKIVWDFGELRGGTQGVLDAGFYLAFFHSSINASSRYSNGEKMTHYFMGAYQFSDNPPFRITKISRRPIVGKHFYTPPYHNTWKPLRVVFPCGVLLDGPFVWVSYGRQDHEMWLIKLNKRRLYRSMVPLKPS